MPAFSYRRYLSRGDELAYQIGDGRVIKFVAGESMSFASTEEVQDFLAHSKEIFFKEYSACFCLGGTAVRRRGLVRA